MKMVLLPKAISRVDAILTKSQWHNSQESVPLFTYFPHHPPMLTVPLLLSGFVLNIATTCGRKHGVYNSESGLLNIIWWSPLSSNIPRVTEENCPQGRRKLHLHTHLCFLIHSHVSRRPGRLHALAMGYGVSAVCWLRFLSWHTQEGLTWVIWEF
jgi:hypothetical protein